MYFGRWQLKRAHSAAVGCSDVATRSGPRPLHILGAATRQNDLYLILPVNHCTLSSHDELDESHFTTTPTFPTLQSFDCETMKVLERCSLCTASLTMSWRR